METVTVSVDIANLISTRTCTVKKYIVKKSFAEIDIMGLSNFTKVQNAGLQWVRWE